MNRLQTAESNLLILGVRCAFKLERTSERQRGDVEIGSSERTNRGRPAGPAEEHAGGLPKQTGQPDFVDCESADVRA